MPVPQNFLALGLVVRLKYESCLGVGTWLKPTVRLSQHVRISPQLHRTNQMNLASLFTCNFWFKISQNYHYQKYQITCSCTSQWHSVTCENPFLPTHHVGTDGQKHKPKCEKGWAFTGRFWSNHPFGYNVVLQYFVCYSSSCIFKFLI